MAKDNDFRQRIKIPPTDESTSVNKEPNFAQKFNREGVDSQKLFDACYNGDRRILDRLNELMLLFGKYIERSFPDVSFNLTGRIKSEVSAQENMANSKNIFDIIGFRLVVTDSAATSTPEQKIREALQLLDSTNLNTMKAELEKILFIYESHKDEIYGSYPICIFQDEKQQERKTIGNSKKTTEKNVQNLPEEVTYRNSEVLLVSCLNEFISRLRKSSIMSVSDRSTISAILQEARDSTSYGTAIFIANSFMDYVNSPHFTDIEIPKSKERNKLVQKGNGYAARHMTLYDTRYGIPVELQFTSYQNQYIADKGPAAHHEREGKGRNLPLVPISTNATRTSQIKAFFNFFDESRLKKIQNTIPFYTIYQGDGNLHTCNMWENFYRYYSNQFEKLGPIQRDLYIIALHLLPQFQKDSMKTPEHGYESGANIDQFPYYILPVVNKLFKERYPDFSLEQ